MKKITKCVNCEKAFIITPIGFTSIPYLYCSERCSEVEKDDGCTFGVKGNPVVAIDAPEVELSDEQIAVYGYHY